MEKAKTSKGAVESGPTERSGQGNAYRFCLLRSDRPKSLKSAPVLLADGQALAEQRFGLGKGLGLELRAPLVHEIFMIALKEMRSLRKLPWRAWSPLTTTDPSLIAKQFPRDVCLQRQGGHGETVQARDLPWARRRPMI